MGVRDCFPFVGWCFDRADLGRENTFLNHSKKRGKTNHDLYKPLKKGMHDFNLLKVLNRVL